MVGCFFGFKKIARVVALFYAAARARAVIGYAVLLFKLKIITNVAFTVLTNLFHTV